MTNLTDMVSDRAVPPEEAYDACNGLLEALTQNKKQYDECYGMIEGTLMSNWPDESFVWLLKGKALYQERLVRPRRWWQGHSVPGGVEDLSG